MLSDFHRRHPKLNRGSERGNDFHEGAQTQKADQRIKKARFQRLSKIGFFV
jgi:hypothetical protein